MTNQKIEDLIKQAKKELDIHFIRSSGHGGQNVNKRSTCCQIIDHFDYEPFLTEDQVEHYHSPITIKHGTRRKQHNNKKEALKIWEEKIREMLAHHFEMHIDTHLSQSDRDHMKESKERRRREQEYRSIFRHKPISHDLVVKPS